jgi:hypothetical protein
LISSHFPHISMNLLPYHEIGTTQETDEIGTTQETDEIGTTQETDEIGTTQKTDEIGTTQKTDEYPPLHKLASLIQIPTDVISVIDDSSDRERLTLNSLKWSTTTPRGADLYAVDNGDIFVFGRQVNDHLELTIYNFNSVSEKLESNPKPFLRQPNAPHPLSSFSTQQITIGPGFIYVVAPRIPAENFNTNFKIKCFDLHGRETSSLKIENKIEGESVIIIRMYNNFLWCAQYDLMTQPDHALFYLRKFSPGGKLLSTFVIHQHVGVFCIDPYDNLFMVNWKENNNNIINKYKLDPDSSGDVEPHECLSLDAMVKPELTVPFICRMYCDPVWDSLIVVGTDEFDFDAENYTANCNVYEISKTSGWGACFPLTPLETHLPPSLETYLPASLETHLPAPRKICSFDASNIPRYFLTGSTLIISDNHDTVCIE